MEEALEEVPDEPAFHYRMTAYLIGNGKYQEAFNFLENALILDFDMHTVLFDFFPNLEIQKVLFKIIDQYKRDNH